MKFEEAVANGADVNAFISKQLPGWKADEEITTTAIFLLFRITTNNKVELVTLLLDRGCDPEEKEDCSGCDALHWASDSGYIVVVKLLLNRGCDANKSDNSGRKPLVFSCS